MSCRTTKSGSAATSLYTIISGLENSQVLSIFHDLRREYSPKYSRSNTEQNTIPTDEWDAFVNRMEKQVNRLQISENRKKSLLARVEASKSEVTDASSWYALQKLEERTLIEAYRIDRAIDHMSSEYNLSRSEVKTIYNNILKNSKDLKSEPLNAREKSFAEKYRLHSNIKTIKAVTLLDNELMLKSFNEEPVGRRVVRNRTLHPARAISSWGYDHRGGRLEIEIVRRDGSHTVNAYHNIPQHVWDELENSSTPAADFIRLVRDVPQYRYRNTNEEQADSLMRRCSYCGQFSDSEHVCDMLPDDRSERPQVRLLADVGLGSIENWRKRSPMKNDWESPGVDDNYTRPVISKLRTESVDGPIEFDFKYEGARYPSEVDEDVLSPDGLPLGDFTVYGTADLDSPEENIYTSHLSNLKCSCPQYVEEYDCPHVHYVKNVVRQDLTSGTQDGYSDSEYQQMKISKIIAAQRIAQESMRDDWTLDENIQTQLREQWQHGNTTSLSVEYETYREYAEEGRRRTQLGESPSEGVVADNVGGGALAPNQGFGVELEFELPDVVYTDDGGVYTKEEALAMIGDRLYEAGLTPTAEQQRHNVRKDEGYLTVDNDTPWSFEKDGTVTGELVSPILYDNEKSWSQLQQVCQIIRECGGEVGDSSGSHVHIGLPESSPEQLTMMHSLANQYEDVIYRLSSAPGKKHRPLSWCTPNYDLPPGGYEYVSDAALTQGEHTLSLNMESVKNEESDHVEFRHWDATLDFSTIQTQILLSAGVTHASKRLNFEQQQKMLGVREKVGSHHKKNMATYGVSTPDEGENDTRTLRHFIDTVCLNNETKRRVAQLAGATEWFNNN